jgi:hypothetical protein
MSTRHGVAQHRAVPAACCRTHGAPWHRARAAGIRRTGVPRLPKRVASGPAWSGICGSSSSTRGQSTSITPTGAHGCAGAASAGYGGVCPRLGGDWPRTRSTRPWRTPRSRAGSASPSTPMPSACRRASSCGVTSRMLASACWCGPSTRVSHAAVHRLNEHFTDLPAVAQPARTSLRGGRVYEIAAPAMPAPRRRRG